MKKLMVALVAAAMTAAVAFGETFTWKGGSGAFTNGEMWDGGVAPTSGANLVFPAVNNTVTGFAGTTTIGNIAIGAGTTEFQFAAAGGTINFNGAISGSSSLRIIASAAPGGVVNYNASSTFSGTIFTVGVKNYLNVNDGLGTASCTFEAITGVAYPFNTGANVDKVANNITCQYNSAVGNNPVADGWMTTAHDVEFTGKYTIYRLNSSTRYYNWRYSGKTATFKGGFAYSDPHGTSSIVYGGGTLIFHATTGNMNLQYNSGSLVVFSGSGAEASTLWWNGWSSAYSTLRFDVDNPFTVGTLPVVRFENLAASQGGGPGGDKIIDLNGHDVTLRTVYNTGAGMNRFVKSDKPATLTLNDNDNHTMRGHFNGALSLVYNSNGHTYTIESGDSSMNGTLRCSAGTIALGDTAEFANLDTIEIAPGAVISAAASAKLATRSLVIEEQENVRGKLKLNGKKITVLSLTINGVMQPAGTYSGTDWLDAGSSVEVIAVSDEAWVWTGAADGKWATLGNWTVAGKVPTAAMPADVEVYIGAASAVKPIIFDVETVIANPITLGVGAQYFQSANTSKVTFTGVIRGPGQFYWQCSAERSHLQFEGENTFDGGVVRDGRGMVICKNGSALGTGKFIQKYSGNATASRAVSLAAGIYVNDFTFAAEGGGANNCYGWDGCLEYLGTVSLTGSVRFEGDTRMTGGGATSHLHFDGPVYVKGRLTTNNADGNYHFHTAVTGGGYLHTDQEYGNWYLYAVPSGFARAYMGGSAYKHSNYLMPMVDGALAETFYADATAGSRGLDLNGTSQTIDYIADMATSCNGSFAIRSATAGKLTLKSSKSVTVGARLDSQASLEYAPKGDYTLTFRVGVGTSEGTLTVSGGTFKLTEGASMLKLSAVDVAAGATLNVDATSGIAAKVLKIGKSDNNYGKLKLNGHDLECLAVIVNGEAQAKGEVFTEKNCGWIDGEGSVKVLYAPTDYVWTGASSTSWTEAGNWLKGGAVPATLPSGDSPIAFPAGNNTVTDFAGTTTIGNIEIGAGTTEFRFAAAGGTIDITGVISGAGRLHVYGPDSVTSTIHLRGANTFTGGLWVDGCQALVYNNSSFGTGAVYARAAANTSGSPLKFYAGVTEIANDVHIGHENQVGRGSIYVDEGVTVRFTGGFYTNNDGDCANRSGTYDPNVRFSGKGSLVLAGKIDLPNYVGTLILAGGKIVFEKIVTENRGPASISFNGGVGIDLMVPNNSISALNWNSWSTVDSTVKVFVDNPIRDGRVSDLVISTGTASGAKKFDLNGHKVAVGGYTATKTDSEITSSAAGGELTIKAKTDQSYAGKLTGDLSIIYDGSGTTWTLTGANNTMSGSLTVKGGTVQLANANMLTRKNSVVLNGGELQLDGNQTIYALYLNGETTAVKPGFYASEEYTGAMKVTKIPQLKGQGVLSVRGNPGLVIFF